MEMQATINFTKVEAVSNYIFTVFMSKLLSYSTRISEFRVLKKLWNIDMLLLFQGKLENVSVYFVNLLGFDIFVDLI